MVKILHLIGGDLSGGAARGAYWLHKGLLDLGVGSKVLTNSKFNYEDPNIITIVKDKKSKIINLIKTQLDILSFRLYKYRKKATFSTGIVGFDFTKTKEYKECDILHLHWINAGFVNIKSFSRVDKPIIWTLRDMWPMTGVCHYALDCKEYKTGCKYCAQLGTGKFNNIARWILKRKIKYYPKNMIVVGISYWLSLLAKESLIFRDFDIRTIHNNIDTKEFFPINKKSARAMLGINTKKKIILTAAQSINDVYKGFNRFLDAIRKLDKSSYLIVFFGNFKENKIIEKLGFQCINIGYLHDNISMRIVYSSADVFVSTSIAEAFGKTIGEAMACGTPVVCLNMCGPKEIIDHKINGYKANPFDIDDLVYGIKWVSNNLEYEKLSKNAREKILKEFDNQIIANRYLKLYKEILKNT